MFSLSYAACTRDFISLRILHIEDLRAVLADYIRFASTRQKLVACNTTLFRNMYLPRLSKLTYAIYTRD
jgi:hypothetical protein